MGAGARRGDASSDPTFAVSVPENEWGNQGVTFVMGRGKSNFEYLHMSLGNTDLQEIAEIVIESLYETLPNSPSIPQRSGHMSSLQQEITTAADVCPFRLLVARGRAGKRHTGQGAGLLTLFSPQPVSLHGSAHHVTVPRGKWALDTLTLQYRLPIWFSCAVSNFITSKTLGSILHTTTRAIFPMCFTCN